MARGLPTGERDRLTEPLYDDPHQRHWFAGLAIVKKIMEDHGGELILEDPGVGGAKVSLWLPESPPAAEPENQAPKVAVNGA